MYGLTHSIILKHWLCASSSILRAFKFIGNQGQASYPVSNWRRYSVVYQMIHYWSTSDIPVATHDLLWVSSVFCEVPRALPGKPGNTKHVIPNPVTGPCPDLPKTQPGTYSWGGARSNPSLYQTVSHKLTVLYKPSDSAHTFVVRKQKGTAPCHNPGSGSCLACFAWWSS